MKKSELMFELEHFANAEMDSMFDNAEALANTIRRYLANKSLEDMNFDAQTATEELDNAVDSIVQAFVTFKVQSKHNNNAPTLQMVLDFTSSVDRAIETHNQALLFEMM